MVDTPRIIAGLGNPGDKYATTRHNAGFWLVDELARRGGESFRSESRFGADVCRVTIAHTPVWLVKPMTYMNRSGGPLRKFLDYYRLPVESLLVAHDEIDLPVASVRLKDGGGHGGHNGLRDTIACVGKSFYRLRIGVDHPGDKNAVVSYVLRSASAKEQREIDKAVDEAADAVPLMVEKGFAYAMNSINRRAKTAAKKANKKEQEDDSSGD